jgi:hypothetical protein
MESPLKQCEYVPLSAYNWATVPLAVTPNAICLLPWNPVVYCLFAAFHAVAIWTAIEVNIQLFTTFKRWKTLYFVYVKAHMSIDSFVLILLSGLKLPILICIGQLLKPVQIPLCYLLGYYSTDRGFRSQTFRGRWEYLIGNPCRYWMGLYGDGVLYDFVLSPTSHYPQ